MSKPEWRTVLPWLGLGGIVLRAGRGSADPDDPDDDNGDDGGGGGGGGGGGDPDPNDSPTVEIDSLSLSGDKIVAEAVATDPDGSISAIDWTLTHESEGTVGMDSGTECSILLTVEGDHTLTVEATDDAGATASDSYDFTYAPKPDPDPNEPPTVTITSLSVSDGVVNASASASDPDGGISSYVWELRKSGTVVDTATGETVTLALGSSDKYTAEVTVKDGHGATASDSYAFTYTGDGGNDPPELDNELRIAKQSDAWVQSYPDTYVLFEATGEINVTGNIPSSDWDGSRGTVETRMSGAEAFTIAYNGSIDILDWNGGPINTYSGGTRVDPYEISGDGPRYKWTDGTSGVVEATVYQSAKQYSRQGPESAQTAAGWLSGALKDQGISHDILHSLPVIDLPSENAQCKNPLRGDDPCWGDDSCSDWDCCATEDFMPSGYYWWRSELNEGGFQDRFREASGTDYRTYGDSWVMRKDSNVMLTDVSGGGCGAVNGTQCTIGADSIGSRSFEKSSGTSTELNQIHNVLHEFGHNMGYHHPKDDCSKGGGRAWIDEFGRWNRYPCVPGNGCENRCGFPIEDRSNTTANGVVFYPWFTECSGDQFKENVASRQGSVRAASDGDYVDEGWGDENIGTCDSC